MQFFKTAMMAQKGNEVKPNKALEQE